MSSFGDEQLERIAQGGFFDEGKDRGEEAKRMTKEILGFDTTTEELAMSLSEASKNGKALTQVMNMVAKLAKKANELVVAQKNVNDMRTEAIVIQDRMKKRC